MLFAAGWLVALGALTAIDDRRLAMLGAAIS